MLASRTCNHCASQGDEVFVFSPTSLGHRQASHLSLQSSFSAWTFQDCYVMGNSWVWCGIGGVGAGLGIIKIINATYRVSLSIIDCLINAKIAHQGCYYYLIYDHHQIFKFIITSWSLSTNNQSNLFLLISTPLSVMLCTACFLVSRSAELLTFTCHNWSGACGTSGMASRKP